MGGDTPDTADLTAMASRNSMTMPVVADAGWAVMQSYAPHHPTRILLAPGAVLVEIDDSVTDADIQALLPVAYP